ncbi:MAG: sulfotransferase family 2 domain-containing protein [Candidatus Marinimicrobia bacterium]|nr:sulfotransferase family 2 domain-containing protein [Candidatus Neomarinimicrobiota bacterium]
MPPYRKHIIFLHIPKTGGTTLRDIFHRQYKKDESILTQRLIESENIIKGLKDEEKNRILMIQGHMKFGLHKHFNNQFKYFTMMREPVKRVLSQYTYLLSLKNKPFDQSTDSGEMTIREYYDSGVSPQLTNGQTQLISGILIDNDSGEISSNRILEKAKQNLEKHFLLVGLTERFNETLLLLKRELGWKTPYYSRANVTKKKQGRGDIREDDIEFVKEKNHLDIQLYDFATGLFNEKLNDINQGFQDQLKRFNRNNKFRAAFYTMPRLKRKIKRIFKSVK